MYQVLGIKHGGTQRLLANPDSAQIALASYTGNVTHYVSIVVVDPSGKIIDLAELTRRAERE
jgi:hypothetical protein